MLSEKSVAIKQRSALMRRKPLFTRHLALTSVTLAAIVLAFGLFAGDTALRGIPVAEAVGDLTATFDTSGDPVSASGTWSNFTGGPCADPHGDLGDLRWAIGINWDPTDDPAGTEPTDPDNQDEFVPLTCTHPDPATRNRGPGTEPAANTTAGMCATLYHAPEDNIQGNDVADTT
jgi:hypothetical protein